MAWLYVVWITARRSALPVLRAMSLTLLMLIVLEGCKTTVQGPVTVLIATVPTQTMQAPVIRTTPTATRTPTSTPIPSITPSPTLAPPAQPSAPLRATATAASTITILGAVNFTDAAVNL